MTFLFSVNNHDPFAGRLNRSISNSQFGFLSLSISHVQNDCNISIVAAPNSLLQTDKNVVVGTIFPLMNGFKLKQLPFTGTKCFDSLSKLFGRELWLNINGRQVIHLIGRVAHVGQRSMIHQPKLQRRSVKNKYLVHRILQDSPELRSLLFSLAQRRQVVQETREDASKTKIDFADGKVKRKRRSVLSPTSNLPTNSNDFCFPGSLVVRQITIVLLTKRRRHQHVDVPPDHFGCRIAEQRFCRRINGFNQTSLVDRNHPINGRIKNRAQPRLIVHCVSRV